MILAYGGEKYLYYTFLGMSPQEAHGTEVQQTAGAHPCPIVIALVSKHDILQLGQP